nr:hypothetical protein [Bacteroidota bacterium]
MTFNRYLAIVTMHVLLLVLFIFLFIWSLQKDYLQFSPYGFAALTLIVAVSLILSSVRSARKTLKFLDSFRVNDQNPNFVSPYRDKYFIEIENLLNQIAREYQTVKFEKEAEHQFLSVLIERLNVGVLVYGHSGKITLSNHAIRHILAVESLAKTNILLARYPALAEDINFSGNFKSALRKVRVEGEAKTLSIKVSKIVLANKNLNIAIIQDISNEISQEEVEGWQKLISILRHEILNSVTPITSVTTSLISGFDDAGLPDSIEEGHQKIISNTYKGLKVIEKRGIGLMDFVKSYKTISSTVKLQLSVMNIGEMLNQVVILFQDEFNRCSIQSSVKISERNLTIAADEKQITQVLINMLRNAVDAVAN